MKVKEVRRPVGDIDSGKSCKAEDWPAGQSRLVIPNINLQGGGSESGRALGLLREPWLSCVSR